VRGARILPGTAQLRRDLLLAGLGGIKTTGEQKQVFDRGLTGPGAQQTGRLARTRRSRRAPSRVPRSARGKDQRATSSTPAWR
jgi:hypothetical protein